MKTKHASDRGQVLVIFVLAIIGLFGLTGLAVDGSNILSDRRHAQNAADTASMAAALFRNNTVSQDVNHVRCDYFNTAGLVGPWLNPPPACSGSIITIAMNRALDNGFNSDNVGNRVDVYSPPKDGPYSTCGDPEVLGFDCRDYIQVIIHTNVNTWFARVLGIGQLHNTVQAVALSKYKPETVFYGGNTLVELYEANGQCPSDFNVGGSGTTILDGGGIFVNSTNQNCAYKQTSCSAGVQLQNGAGIQVNGGYALSHCSTGIESSIVPASTHYSFPPKPLIDPEPAECALQPAHAPSTVAGITTYWPGRYYNHANSTFPIVNGPSILNPGVYCVDNFQTTKDITGTEVMIYIRPTGYISLTGGNPSTLPNIKLTPPTTAPYAGFLIYQAYNSTSSLVGCKIAGGAGTEYSGMIFAPYCKMALEGTSDAHGIEAQVVAGTMSLSGSQTLNFKYNEDDFPKDKEINQAGQMH